MDGYTPNNAHLASKIARLIEEKGWNQEEFARISRLNRHTVREILKHGDSRRLRNATISQCADAFGLQVNELRNLPLEALIQRIHGVNSLDSRLSEQREPITQPELKTWLEKHPDRAAELTAEEMQELIALQGVGTTFTHLGVEHFVQLLERKRKLFQKVRAIAATPQLAFLEQLVEMVYEKAIHTTESAKE